MIIECPALPGFLFGWGHPQPWLLELWLVLSSTESISSEGLIPGKRSVSASWLLFQLKALAPGTKNPLGLSPSYRPEAVTTPRVVSSSSFGIRRHMGCLCFSLPTLSLLPWVQPPLPSPRTPLGLPFSKFRLPPPCSSLKAQKLIHLCNQIWPL